MKQLLQQIMEMAFLEIPKDRHSQDKIEYVFGKVSGETDKAWLIPCTHAFNPPAEVEQIEDAERRLGLPIPEEYL